MEREILMVPELKQRTLQHIFVALFHCQLPVLLTVHPHPHQACCPPPHAGFPAFLFLFSRPGKISELHTHLIMFNVLYPEKVKVKVAYSCLTLCDPMDCSPWNSPGQNTGVGSLSLLQGTFPTQ